MGVYIKGMKKPKNCHECVFGKYEVCAINISVEKKDTITHSCPLVDVPPHGRLIDADALIKTDNMVDKMMMFGGQYVYTESEIDNAPTVIPAEEWNK